MKKLAILIQIITISFLGVECLDNGLALTPPMGWMTWQRFGCLTNCELYPNDCLSEDLILQMAHAMVNDGYLAAGYEYLIIDDCWLASTRTKEGLLQPDPDRFPHGIPYLSDKVHSLGLKFGIYEDYGKFTCAGYPGILGHLETDAKTLAEWHIDYLKLDGCYVEEDGMEEGYAEMGRYLNETGRPIVYSCSFPAYKGLKANYSKAAQYCNLYRNYGDIDDSWHTVHDIMYWFSDNQDFLLKYSGPGHWNDPDMLIIGNYGLSYEQSKAQMTVWSILAAPLIISVDLRTIQPQFKQILLNKEAIRINQDPLGAPGRKHSTVGFIDIWIRNITSNGQPAHALGFVSGRVDGYPYRLEINLEDLDLENPKGYQLIDVFEDQEPVYVKDTIVIRIPPSGGILFKLIPEI